jgi:hypothetical protein
MFFLLFPSFSLFFSRSSKIAKNDPSTDAERHLSNCGLLAKLWMPTITILSLQKCPEVAFPLQIY